uniref:EF-hand domain-containing protein n=1 Tax=Aureoumbra lagunensis TaxID=44058 RepID=A0A7S3JV65_9STRA|mmetsp:Transcript_4114/g.5376  ORF Transcript_4114/g.5376 Transcript_4114/m.5376 type:complete len:403 (+) Transcript_4114:175-1383(+)
MRRVVRSKSHRRKPSVIQGHSWTLEEIRERPEEAYKLFDARGDGQVTVAQLLFTARKTSSAHRKRGSIFDEMKLFEVLDIDGDAVISSEEFCEVVRDPEQFSDEALAAIAKMATRKEKEKVEKKDDGFPQVEEDADADDLDAATATMGLVQGLSLRKSKKSNLALPSSPNSPRKKINESYHCELHLVAINVASAAILPPRSWYQKIISFGPPENSCSPFIVIFGKVRTINIELARTNVVKDSLGATFDLIYLSHKTLSKLDTPFQIFFKIYDATNDNMLLGTTPPFDLLPPHVDPVQESAFGPFSALDEQDDVTAKLIGTRRWILQHNFDQDNSSKPFLQDFFSCSEQQSCLSSSVCVFAQAPENNNNASEDSQHQDQQIAAANMRAIAASRLQSSQQRKGT